MFLCQDLHVHNVGLVVALSRSFESSRHLENVDFLPVDHRPDLFGIVVDESGVGDGLAPPRDLAFESEGGELVAVARLAHEDEGFVGRSKLDSRFAL